MIRGTSPVVEIKPVFGAKSSATRVKFTVLKKWRSALPRSSFCERQQRKQAIDILPEL
jgi:hypothetical protein